MSLWMHEKKRVGAVCLLSVFLLTACTPVPPTCTDPDITDLPEFESVAPEETTEAEIDGWEETRTDCATEEETTFPYWEHTPPMTTTASELEETTEPEEESGTRVVELAPGGYTVDAVITYFHEVVHSSEYSFGTGESNSVHKWIRPIYYQLHGDYTSEDVEVIGEICRQLNEVEGFPGMYVSPDEDTANMDMYFYDQDRMNEEYGYMVNYEVADGLMTYWYSNRTNDILEAMICCRSDVSQGLRNSVIVEEIFNSLGMPNDTKVRSDSVLYQYGSAVTQPSELDWLLLRLLYHEKMLCGYDCDSSVAVIRELCAEWTKNS